MSRLASGLAALSFALALAARAEPSVSPAVYLNAPGAMAALKHDNPSHFAKIQGILAKLCEVPDEEVPGVVTATFEAREVAYLPYILVTDPPKKRLSFVLDSTNYSAVLTLRTSGGRNLPAHCPRKRPVDPNLSVEVIE